MSPRIRRLASVVAGVLAAAGGLVGATAPVAAGSSAAAGAAAGCSGATGVTVVVDFNELGGQQAGCDASAGGYAAQNFKDAGFSLTRAQQDPSFVCRVNGLPGEDVESCTDAASGDRYWSLWVSDGKSGTWSYATRGVDSLRVPEGGYVAFSWDQVSGNRAPDYDPAPHAASPTPTPSGATSGGSGSSGGSGTKHSGGSSSSGSKPGTGSTGGAGTGGAAPSASGSASATATASPSASPTAKKRRKKAAASATPTPTSEVSALDETTQTPTEPADAAADDDGGFPVWLAGLLAVVVLGAAGAVPILRARR